MVIRYRFLLLLLGFTVSSGIFGMDSGDSQAVARFDQRSQALVDRFNAVQKGGEIKFASPFFSDPRVQKALIEASKRGVSVEVKTIRSRADLELLKKSGVKVVLVKDLHAKFAVCQNPVTDEKDKENAHPNTKRPAKAAPKKCAQRGKQEDKGQSDQKKEWSVTVGSDNFSKISPFHREMILMKREDSPYAKKARQAFEKAGNKTPEMPRKKTVLKVTPVKDTLFSSQECASTASKAARLDKLITHAAAGNAIDISSMTFDSEEMVAKIEEIYKKCPAGKRPHIRIFLDRSAAKHDDLLKRMQKAGGSDLKIFIFNEDKEYTIFNKFPQIQHRKVMNRHLEGAAWPHHLTVVSTGNLTGRSDTEFNIDSYHPDNDQLFEDVQKSFDALQLESKEYRCSDSDGSSSENENE